MPQQTCHLGSQQTTFRQEVEINPHPSQPRLISVSVTWFVDNNRKLLQVRVCVPFLLNIWIDGNKSVFFCWHEVLWMLLTSLRNWCWLDNLIKKYSRKKICIINHPGDFCLLRCWVVLGRWVVTVPTWAGRVLTRSEYSTICLNISCGLAGQGEKKNIYISADGWNTQTAEIFTKLKFFFDVMQRCFTHCYICIYTGKIKSKEGNQHTFMHIYNFFGHFW